MSPQTRTTVTVAASASLAMLALLVALPFYVLAIIQVMIPNHVQPERPRTFETVPTAVQSQDLHQYQDSFVDPTARDEVKGQISGCPTCPPQQTTTFRRPNRWFSPQPSRPQIQPSNWTVVDHVRIPYQPPTIVPAKPSVNNSSAKPNSVVSKADEKKHGAWVCQKCKKLVPGQDMETYWAEDRFGNSIPVTFLCESCAANSNTIERRLIMQSWLDKQGIKLDDESLQRYVNAIK